MRELSSTGESALNMRMSIEALEKAVKEKEKIIESERNEREGEKKEMTEVNLM